ncbi:Hypothetical predicted protein [Olea europaea subsp. europaea]|uniref:Uncharacterized protein n=1 Tax=Olea europaea subsp. europaea TaxID=158383 RepID=A0A8S0QSK3_OLEEU|nr:Hypothetical predicted protein [Olea europaea subsp. europaea]
MKALKMNNAAKLDKGKGKEVLIEPPKRWIPVQRDQKRQHDASTSRVQIPLSVSTVITSVPLPTGTSSHAQTQPSVPPIAPPSATALPVISVVDPVTSTTPSAPAQAISPPITPFYDPMLDEMLKRPQTQNSTADTVSRASYILGPTPGRAQAPISTSSPPDLFDMFT